MVTKLVNQTNYANIYHVCEDDGKVVGTVEQRLAGRDCGIHCRTWSGKYTNKDIRRYWNEYRKG